MKKTPILDQTAYLIARRSEIQTEGLNQQDLKLQCWTMNISADYGHVNIIKWYNIKQNII